MNHWQDAEDAGWVSTLIDRREEEERSRRRFERRLKDAQIGRFKPLCDFDGLWLKKWDRAVVEILGDLAALDSDATLRRRLQSASWAPFIGQDFRRPARINITDDTPHGRF